MNRRTALTMLPLIVGRGLVGSEAILEGREANITIPLDKLVSWKVTFGKEELIISGREIFDSLKGAVSRV